MRLLYSDLVIIINVRQLWFIDVERKMPACKRIAEFMVSVDSTCSLHGSFDRAGN